MPLTRASLAASIGWTLSKSNTNSAYGSTTVGPGSLSYSQQSPSLATWTEPFAVTYGLLVSAPTGLAASLATGGTLTVGTAYYYKVTATVALDNTQETTASGEVSATPTSGNQTAALTWNVLQGATGYNVYRGTSAGAENLLVGTASQPSSGTTVTFSDTGFSGSSQTPPASMPNNYIEFSLRTFTDLGGAAVVAGHVLAIQIMPTGANATCVLTPGASNGLTWFVPATGLTIPINGCEFHAEDTAGAGEVLDSTHNTLRITNGGTAGLTVGVAAIVGP